MKYTYFLLLYLKLPITMVSTYLKTMFKFVTTTKSLFKIRYNGFVGVFELLSACVVFAFVDVSVVKIYPMIETPCVVSNVRSFFVGSYISHMFFLPRFKGSARFTNIAPITILAINCTLAHHLSLGSSMVRTSHRSSESCGFDPRLGLRNRFSE